MIDDCLVLLDYVSKHPDDEQTYESLADATNIPTRTIKRICSDGRIQGDSILARTATKYRFDFRLYTGHKRNKQILWASYIGYGRPD